MIILATGDYTAMVNQIFNKLFIITSIFFITPTHSMEKNNTLNPIDKIMLEHSIKEKGYSNLRSEIGSFALRKSAKNIPSNTPFIIKHQLLKSELPDCSFSETSPKSILNIKKKQRSIDCCTTLETTSNPKYIMATATFSDVTVLCCMLRTLKMD